MNIILTGGAGYIGQRLLPNLTNEGYNVLVVDPCYFGEPSLPETANLSKTCITKIADAELEWADAIIHLGGLSNDPMAHFSPGANFKLNAAATVHLAYRAARAGVKRFVMASTASVYQGISQAVKAVPQNLHLSPNEPYAISKLMAEQGVALASGDMTVGILRKGTVGGYSPRMRYDLMVNTMYRYALTKNEVTVYVDEDGRAVMRPHLDINDAVEAYMTALHDRRTSIWNVASCNVNVMDAARAVQAETGCRIQTAFVEDRTLLRNYVMGRLMPLSSPRTIEDTVVELKRLAPTDFENPYYYNINIWKQRQEHESSDNRC